MGKKRKTFSGKEKATIALEALRERQTLSEIAQKYEVHPTQVSVYTSPNLQPLINKKDYL